VKKCLDAGFDRVAVVSPKPERLKQIAEAVQAGLGRRHSPRWVTTSPMILFPNFEIGGRNKTRFAVGSSRGRIHGYRVNRRGPALTPEERQTKEKVALQMMAEAMKRKR